MWYRIIYFKLFNLKNIFHWYFLLTIFYYVHWVYIFIVWHAYQINVALLNFLFCLKLEVAACLARYIQYIAQRLALLNKAFPQRFLIRLRLKLMLLRLLFVFLSFLDRRILKNQIPFSLIKRTSKISTRINLLSILFFIIYNLTNNPGRFDIKIG